MPAQLQSTSDALAGNAVESRSLRLSRFAEPTCREKERRDYFSSAFQLKPEDGAKPLDRWLQWLIRDLKVPPSDLVFGKLQSRLALHLSGGVMENAGILLDRFGYPHIPGSAVKGLARRAALYALRTWCVDGGGIRPVDPAEPATAICSGFKTSDHLAVGILRAFGWTDGEWADGRTKVGELRSDFEWAVGEGQPWLDAILRIAALLESDYRTKLVKGRPARNFGGRAHFLDAKPISIGYPAAPDDLELDVVTCHHGDYYAGRFAEAHDTEDPVPIFFPAVAPGVTFVFAIHGTDADSNKLARASLAVALTTFGAGAKTAAGYGWFDVEDATRTHVSRLEKETAERRRLDERPLLAPDPTLLADFKAKKPDQIRGLINAFACEERFWTNTDERYQLSLFCHLTIEDRSLWEGEKAKAKSKVGDALRALAAKFNRSLS